MGLFRRKNKNFILFPQKFVFLIFWEIKFSSPKIKKKKNSGQNFLSSKSKKKKFYFEIFFYILGNGTGTLGYIFYMLQ